MFSLNYALKAFKNPAAFNRLHEALKNGRSPDASGQSRETTTIGLVEDYYGQLLETHAANGADMLPADFYKHAHSSGQIKKLMSHPDRPMSGPVNSAGTENLAERNQAFRVGRENDKGGKIQTSASIDGFRLQEIRRLLDAQG